MKHFSLQSSVKRHPSLPFETIKNDILGRTHTLSLTFIGETRARNLNKVYRKKSYVPNVLSFPLDEETSEIYITPAVAKREAKKFGMTYTGFVGYLFIHGLLHLKGYDHGTKMERLEQRFLKKYRLA